MLTDLALARRSHSTCVFVFDAPSQMAEVDDVDSSTAHNCASLLALCSAPPRGLILRVKEARAAPAENAVEFRLKLVGCMQDPGTGLPGSSGILR